jgi:hypothetical protein
MKYIGVYIYGQIQLLTSHSHIEKLKAHIRDLLEHVSGQYIYLFIYLFIYSH